MEDLEAEAEEGTFRGSPSPDKTIPAFVFFVGAENSRRKQAAFLGSISDFAPSEAWTIRFMVLETRWETAFPFEGGCSSDLHLAIASLPISSIERKRTLALDSLLFLTMSAAEATVA